MSNANFEFFRVRINHLMIWLIFNSTLPVHHLLRFITSWIASVCWTVDNVYVRNWARSHSVCIIALGCELSKMQVSVNIARRQQLRTLSRALGSNYLISSSKCAIVGQRQQRALASQTLFSTPALLTLRLRLVAICKAALEARRPCISNSFNISLIHNRMAIYLMQIGGFHYWTTW
jgi:hypothetical protein